MNSNIHTNLIPLFFFPFFKLKRKQNFQKKIALFFYQISILIKFAKS